MPPRDDAPNPKPDDIVRSLRHATTEEILKAIERLKAQSARLEHEGAAIRDAIARLEEAKASARAPDQPGS